MSRPVKRFSEQEPHAIRFATQGDKFVMLDVLCDVHGVEGGGVWNCTQHAHLATAHDHSPGLSCQPSCSMHPEFKGRIEDTTTTTRVTSGRIVGGSMGQSRPRPEPRSDASGVSAVDAILGTEDSTTYPPCTYCLGQLVRRDEDFWCASCECFVRMVEDDSTTSPASPCEYIDIVFDGPPSHVTGRFVEAESPAGISGRFGEWIDRGDGYWALRIPNADAERARIRAGVEALRDEKARYRDESVLGDSEYFEFGAAARALDDVLALIDGGEDGAEVPTTESGLRQQVVGLTVALRRAKECVETDASDRTTLLTIGNGLALFGASQFAVEQWEARNARGGDDDDA